ncbi:MAG: hypothetical protein IPM21_02615 [Acidobacteria bacterium]|nr:hypothetical protein [Acidobacteriota bacterium]
MQFLSVIKRVIPFVFAVTIGVLIASIFVPLSSPTESFKSSFKNRHDCKRFKREMRGLRRENVRLTMENEELRMTVERLNNMASEITVTPPMPPAPAPPVYDGRVTFERVR